MEMGSSGGSSGGSSSTESSSLTGGLRFGKKIYFEDGGGVGSSRSRVRVGGSGQTGKQAKCLVEGCRMDLSNAKAYYSRHRVCSIHSKSPKVIVSGLHQRFCQQCSRFHQLAEFDLEKRSCRRRLAGHNERRRKPQPETLLTSRYTRIAPSLYGNANTAINRSFLGDGTGRVLDSRGMERPVSASSWLTNLENHQLNVFSNGSTSFTSQVNMNNSMNTYNGMADSSCALSLLSNPHQQPSTIWRPFSAFNPGEVTMAQPPTVSSHQHCPNQPWEFKAGDKSSLHYTSPVLGQSQISEPSNFQISGGTTMDGYQLSHHQQVRRQYMELENTRAYDSSSQHVNWSL